MPHIASKPLIDLFLDTNFVDGGHIAQFGPKSLHDDLAALETLFNLKVYIPELVVEETLSHRAAQISKMHERCAQGIEIFPVLCGRSAPSLPPVTRIRNRLLRATKDDFRKRGFSKAKCKISQRQFRTIAYNAAWKRTSFADASDPSAFKDAIIWETVLAAEGRKNAKRIFATKDGRLYSFLKSYKGSVIIVDGLDKLRAMEKSLTKEAAEKLSTFVNEASMFLKLLLNQNPQTRISLEAEIEHEFSEGKLKQYAKDFPEGNRLIDLQQLDTEIIDYASGNVSSLMTTFNATVSSPTAPITLYPPSFGLSCDLRVKWRVTESSQGMAAFKLTSIKIVAAKSVAFFPQRGLTGPLGTLGDYTGGLTAPLSSKSLDWMKELTMPPVTNAQREPYSHFIIEPSPRDLVMAPPEKFGTLITPTKLPHLG